MLDIPGEKGNVHYHHEAAVLKSGALTSCTACVNVAGVTVWVRVMGFCEVPHACDSWTAKAYRDLCLWEFKAALQREVGKSKFPSFRNRLCTAQD